MTKKDNDRRQLELVSMSDQCWATARANRESLIDIVNKGKIETEPERLIVMATLSMVIADLYAADADMMGRDGV